MSLYTLAELATWNLARDLFTLQRNSVATGWGGAAPLVWEDIGTDQRLTWWEKARAQEPRRTPAGGWVKEYTAVPAEIPDEPPTRPDIPSLLPKRQPTLTGLGEDE